MNLVRWNPWTEMESLRNRFNRWFDMPELPAVRGDSALSLTAWNPAVDVYENDSQLVIKAELPGLDKDAIEVNVEGRLLTLKGERNHENEVKEGSYYCREMSYGRFERSFTLPSEVNPDEIKADFKDGVLKIEVPKPEEAKPKKISVH